MNIEELQRVDADCRRQKPGIFKLARPDRRATPSEVDALETMLGVKLPERLRQFWQVLGGGDIALEPIYSATPESIWYLHRKAEVFWRSMSREYLPITDDGTGGYYVLRLHEGLADDAVFYFDSDDNSVQKTQDTDILEFIARYAYEPA